MSFLKKVEAAPSNNEAALNAARTVLVKNLMKYQRNSAPVVTALKQFRDEWKLFYGFIMDKGQESRFLDVLSEREADVAPQLDQKKKA